MEREAISNDDLFEIPVDDQAQPFLPLFRGRRAGPFELRK